MGIAVGLPDVPRHIRGRIAAAIRERGHALTRDIAAALVDGGELDLSHWNTFSGVVIDLMALAVEEGHIDERRGAIHDLAHLTAPLSLRYVFNAVHRGEGAVLEELANDEQLGAASDQWPMVAHAVRGATLELVTAIAEQTSGRPALRDPLTTLLNEHVFNLVLAQEAQRAQRQQHGVSMILFDVDDLSQLNRDHGYGAGDRLLERLGILARRFFRTHDWVARHGDDSIAVLLPEATLDQASLLASRFCETVQHRLVLVEHKTDARTTVTVSAAAVGIDLVRDEIDARAIVAEARAAVVRAKTNGGNRVERVELSRKSR